MGRRRKYFGSALSVATYGKIPLTTEAGDEGAVIVRRTASENDIKDIEAHNNKSEIYSSALRFGVLF